jgi:predicted Zn-dependent protease
LGEISARLGDESRAEGLLGGVVRQRPQHAEAALAYALWVWRHDDQKRAERLMADITNGAPGRTVAAQIALAQFFTATGRAGDAVAPARRATEYAPNEVTAVYRMVTALLRAGRRAEAVMEVKLMIRRFPQAPLSWAAAAEISAGGGRTSEDDAKRSFEQWLKLAPGDAMAQAGQALYMLHLQKSSRARELLQAATTTAPKNGFLWGAYGTVLERAGDVGGAAATREKADRLLPDRATATLLY